MHTLCIQCGKWRNARHCAANKNCSLVRFLESGASMEDNINAQ